MDYQKLLIKEYKNAKEMLTHELFIASDEYQLITAWARYGGRLESIIDGYELEYELNNFKE